MLDKSLNINLSGIIFYLKIKKYYRSSAENWDWEFSDVDFCLKSDDWLNYELLNSSLLLMSDIEYLRDNLKALINGEIKTETVLYFFEPVLKFVLYSDYCGTDEDYDDRSVAMDMQVIFWDEEEGLTNNMISIYWSRSKIIMLLNYLELVTNEKSINNVHIKKLIEEGIICEE